MPKASMPPFTGPDICTRTACEVVDLLRRREVSPAELVEASLSRIATVEPQINAVVTVCGDRARAAVAVWDGGDPDRPGWLGGLPIGIKDLNPVAGVRCTLGTKGYADFVPEESDPLVVRLESRGGVVMGMTNTPEMGIGGHTFNDVFGITRNPWNSALTAGGSSGGAAASLASGEVWLSHGSDHSGSLRTPAAYCGIVGLRPSPGVAGGSKTMQFMGEGTSGPMARNVADVALFLDAMAGWDAQWPIAYPAPRRPYLDSVRAGLSRPPRIAWAPTLGGFAPCEPAVRDVLEGALRKAEGQGATVEQACPELPGLARTYLALRAMGLAAQPGRLPEAVQRHFKPVLAANIAEGRALTVEQIIDAQIDRSTIYQFLRGFLDGFDVLACPVAGLPAWPVEWEYPQAVDGKAMHGYLDWMKFSWLATTTGCPAMSLPAGLMPDGTPMGIQLIGPPRGEAKLLQVAAFLEAAIGWEGLPIDPVRGRDSGGPAGPIRTG